MRRLQDILANDKICLKLITKYDFLFFKEIYQDVELMRYIGKPFSDDEAKTKFNLALKQLSKPQPKYIYYVIYLKSNKEKIGTTGLIWNQNNPETVEIGTIIKKSYQLQHVAQSAMQLLMLHAFKLLNIKTVVGICDAENTIVNSMVASMGFKKIKNYWDSSSNKPKIRWEITLKRLGKRLKHAKR